MEHAPLHRGLPQGQPRAIDFYVYSFQVASLAAGASSTVSVNVEADSWFEVAKTAYRASVANATQTNDSRVVPLIDITIFDTGSGKQLSSEPIDIATFAGHDGLPLILPSRRVFQPSSTMRVTFTNTSAAATYTNIQLNFMGNKLWY